MKSLLCKICNEQANAEPIALFDPENISLPLYASAFLPVDNESPFPPRGPDWPDVEWYFMHCPNCGANPFGVPEMEEEALQSLDYLEILTTDGLFRVPSEQQHKAKQAILFKKFEPVEPVEPRRRPGRPVGSKSTKKVKKRKK